MELLLNEVFSLLHDYKILIASVWIMFSFSVIQRFIFAYFGLRKSKKIKNKSNKSQFFISCKTFLCRFKRHKYKYKIILEKKPNRLL